VAGAKLLTQAAGQRAMARRNNSRHPGRQGIGESGSGVPCPPICVRSKNDIGQGRRQPAPAIREKSTLDHLMKNSGAGPPI